MELFQYPDRLVHISISNVTCFTVGKGKEAAVLPDVNHLAVHATIHSRCHHVQSSTVCVASKELSMPCHDHMCGAQLIRGGWGKYEGLARL